MDTTTPAETEWSCKFCQHVSSSKSNLLKHLRRINPCINTENPNTISDYIEELTKKEYNEKTYDCKFCGTKFNAYQNRHRHYKTCKYAPKEDDVSISSSTDSGEQSTITIEDLQLQISEQKDLIYILEQRILELERIVGSSQDVNTSQQPQEASTSANQPKKKNKISSALRIACWNRYIGDHIAKANCLCCRSTIISMSQFQCGHVKSHADGGEATLSNLRPICANCNGSMGRMNMRDFARAQFGVELDKE